MDVYLWLNQILQTLESPFLAGLLISIVFSIVPGPINIILVEQTIEKGAKAGLGIAVANVIGALIALFIAAMPMLFGIHFLVSWLENNVTLASSILSAALLGVGFYMVLSPDGPRKPQPPKVGYTLWTFAYSALQPVNILINMAFLSGLQAIDVILTPLDILPIFVAYFIGTLVVWLGYISAAHRIRNAIAPATMHRLKTILGGLLVVWSVGALLYLFAF